MLTDHESRELIIQLLTAPTPRDKQKRIGASNLCNGCDYCLAANLTGDMRDTPLLDRVWGGRVIGTAIHGLLEERLNLALSLPEDDGIDRWNMGGVLSDIGRRHPDALVEHRMTLGTLGSYGEIGSTADLVLPGEQQAFDHKGTTIQKLCILIDFIEGKAGRPAPYGRTHAKVKLSEKEYAKEMQKMEYKATSYFGQCCLYGLGLNREGIPIKRVTINFIARDHAMFFDNPTLDRYTDPKATKGIWSLGFDYSEEYAMALWNRGLFIWEKLEAGAVPTDFARNPLCWPCSMDAERVAKVDMPDIEVSFGAAA